METTTGVDTFDWLDAIERHPATSSADSLVALGMLGVATDGTPDEMDEGALRLHFAGFLRPVAIDGNEWTYQLAVPPETVAA
ncbi:hypothetical protein Rhow_006899 [Rhodococcus wratislaviensis]|uniref:Uncharacterized protein n=1 Tax=Rhodococcus wratislaviensis TaxID=44752 RepID=A0A402CGP8_RHOWR|nr:hypothetical protein [Rhodococcus wratislaviensis]GCE42770.1 hypothetical protein Rhow_006899 [Rhodococcus wratislaviensis]